jgi:hypothetical protein
MKSVRCYSLLLLCFCTLALAGCAVNPVTGEQQIMLLSEHDESQLGRQTDQSVIDQYGLYDDAGLQRYLQTIGQTMGRNSHRPSLDWQFKVMDSPVLNAFAAPGGYIYVTRGLLASINNEAELAGVLGHEIGHVTARHSAQQYSNKMLADLGLGLGKSLLGGYGDLLAPILETGVMMSGNQMPWVSNMQREPDTILIEPLIFLSLCSANQERTGSRILACQNFSPLIPIRWIVKRLCVPWPATGRQNSPVRNLTSTGRPSFVKSMAWSMVRTRAMASVMATGFICRNSRPSYRFQRAGNLRGRGIICR